MQQPQSIMKNSVDVAWCTSTSCLSTAMSLTRMAIRMESFPRRCHSHAAT